MDRGVWTISAPEWHRTTNTIGNDFILTVDGRIFVSGRLKSGKHEVRYINDHCSWFKKKGEFIDKDEAKKAAEDLHNEFVKEWLTPYEPIQEGGE